MRQFVLDMVMDSVIREVQISNFVEKICGKAIEWKEGEHPQTGAPGSAEEASRDTVALWTRVQFNKMNRRA